MLSVVTIYTLTDHLEALKIGSNLKELSKIQSNPFSTSKFRRSPIRKEVLGNL